MPRWRRWLVMAVAGPGLLAAGLGGCTGQDEPGIPTAGGAPTAAAGADPLAQELEFVACMREKGIADMPDPVPGDTSGRSAVKYAIDVMGKGSDQLFQAALDECITLLPPPPAPDPGSTTVDYEALRPFAQCMRDNGLPEFPDPDAWEFGDFDTPGPAEDPGSSHVAVVGIAPGLELDLGDPVTAAAFQACHGLLTEGSRS